MMHVHDGMEQPGLMPLFRGIYALGDNTWFSCRKYEDDMHVLDMQSIEASPQQFTQLLTRGVLRAPMFFQSCSNWFSSNDDPASPRDLCTPSMAPSVVRSAID